MALFRKWFKGDLKQIGGGGGGRYRDKERFLDSKFVNVTDLQVTNTLWIQIITCN